jgi:hypothetical protein
MKGELLVFIKPSTLTQIKANKRGDRMIRIVLKDESGGKVPRVEIPGEDLIMIYPDEYLENHPKEMERPLGLMIYDVEVIQ